MIDLVLETGGDDEICLGICFCIVVMSELEMNLVKSEKFSLQKLLKSGTSQAPQRCFKEFSLEHDDVDLSG